MHIKPTEIKMCMYRCMWHLLFGLKNMTTYQTVKSTAAGPVTNTYLELKMLLILFSLRK